MTRIDRIVETILHDPWTSRIFLAFTVGMFLSCSAEFAAGQQVAVAHRPSDAVGAPVMEAPNVMTRTMR